EAVRVSAVGAAGRVHHLALLGDGLGPADSVCEPAVPGVRVLGDQPLHARPRVQRADEDRRPGRARSTWEELELADAVEAPLEVEPALVEKAADDRERLLETADRLLVVEAEDAVLGFGVPRADAQDEAPAADVVDGVGDLG